MYKASKALLEGTKAAIDTVYEFTKDGFDGTFTALNDSRLTKVVTELVKRGVIARKKLPGNKMHYQWVAPSAPTKTFYLSVANALGERQQMYDMRYHAKTRGENKGALMPVLPESEALPIQEAEVPVKGLKDYSIEELWGELQSRGIVIEDNHLVIIERRVIA